MFTIHLNNLRFFSFHGVFEAEQMLGNEFMVDVDISFDGVEELTELHQTIDYGTVYAVIKARMDSPSALLETVAQDLAHAIHAMDGRSRSVSVRIIKQHPPLQAFEGSVGVSYKKDF